MRNTVQHRRMLVTALSAGLGAILGNHFLTPYFKRILGA